MEKPTFNSSLNDEEISAGFAGTDAFSGIMSGLNEALDFERGNAKAGTVVRKRSLPDDKAKRSHK